MNIIFKKDFIKIRPNWLKNTDTNYSMEIDMYNEELNIACEYNGLQHYKFSSLFHKKYEDFLLQQKRDIIKYETINKRGTQLIIIPYNIKKINLLDYIINECNNKNINLDGYLTPDIYKHLHDKYCV